MSVKYIWKNSKMTIVILHLIFFPMKDEYHIRGFSLLKALKIWWLVTYLYCKILHIKSTPLPKISLHLINHKDNQITFLGWRVTFSKNNFRQRSRDKVCMCNKVIYHLYVRRKRRDKRRSWLSFRPNYTL